VPEEGEAEIETARGLVAEDDVVVDGVDETLVVDDSPGPVAQMMSGPY
jgi:hypothetical protein